MAQRKAERADKRRYAANDHTTECEGHLQQRQRYPGRQSVQAGGERQRNVAAEAMSSLFGGGDAPWLPTQWIEEHLYAYSEKHGRSDPLEPSAEASGKRCSCCPAHCWHHGVKATKERGHGTYRPHREAVRRCPTRKRNGHGIHRQAKRKRDQGEPTQDPRFPVRTLTLFKPASKCQGLRGQRAPRAARDALALSGRPTWCSSAGRASGPAKSAAPLQPSSTLA